MIDERELRISNWVIGSTAETPAKVGYHQVTAFDLYGQRNHFFEPVEIFPDLLEKCGASKVNGEYVLKIGAIKIKFRTFSKEWYSELEDIYMGSHIQYLHQLQNLYFDLAGKELNVQL